MISIHKSVLLNETIDGLDIKKGAIVVDCTLNGGGHSERVLERYGEGVRVIGLDADAGAIERANARIGAHKNFIAICSNFRNLDKALRSEGIEEVNGFMFDLGLSSNQLESSGRGFTFQKDEPLLMTFASNPGTDSTTAETIVNEWAEDSIEAVLKGFGEESFSARIAKAIVLAREKEKIVTTGQLREIIYHSVPVWYRKKKIHPATKSFQALRIAVNEEFEVLKEGLDKAWNHLANGGRISIISFHSIEDRIVKFWMKDKVKEGLAKAITKKPIIATREEIKENPRSRSAKLRVLEKIGN